jgi:hypothetical protein
MRRRKHRGPAGSLLSRSACARLRKDLEDQYGAITYGQMEKKTGISKQLWHVWLTRQGGITMPSFLRIKKALSYDSPDWLFPA